MSQLFGLNKPNTDLRKNVFDLSEKTVFSMSAGMLVPCLCREVNPGEKFKIELSALTRTQNLNTASFVRCRQYYHFFFVPYKQLWSGWDNFINGVDYRTSTAQSTKGYKRVPALDLNKALSALVKKGFINGTRVNPMGSENRFMASDEFWKNEEMFDELGYPFYLGMSRLLDMLGYGFASTEADASFARNDRYKTLSSFADLIEGKFIPTTSIGTPIYGTNISGTQHNAINQRLIEFERGTLKVNPFRLLAYQKIYSDFYKRDDYEGTNPFAFNMDDLDGSTDYPLDGKRLRDLLRIRYRWLPKDYFTGVVPSELFGVTTSSKIMEYNPWTNAFNFAEQTQEDDKEIRIGSDGVGVPHAPGGGVTTKSIRAAYAIEKLLRLTRRAGGQDYISQTSAHYGFEPPRGRGDKVEFLGGFSNSINITEVLNTAMQDGEKLGDVGGRGIGSFSENQEIDFQAKEHGIVMCITSVVPDTEYAGEGLNRFNAKFDRGDYFQPELQDLGLQPVYGYELKNYFTAKDLEQHAREDILGFVPAYSEYKTAYDTVHGEFRNGKTLSYWVSRSLLDYNKGAMINSLKIDPKCLNPIFATKFNGSEVTDQFLVNAYFSVKAIRPMSITGQNL